MIHFNITGFFEYYISYFVHLIIIFRKVNSFSRLPKASVVQKELRSYRVQGCPQDHLTSDTNCLLRGGESGRGSGLITLRSDKSAGGLPNWKLLHLFFYFSGRNGPKEEVHGAESPEREASSCPLPVDSWAAPTFPGQDMWQYTWNTAPQGASPELLCTELLLGLRQVDMVDSLCDWPFISSPSAGQADALWLKTPSINHAVRLFNMVQDSPSKRRYSYQAGHPQGLEVPPRNLWQWPDISGKGQFFTTQYPTLETATELHTWSSWR